MAKQPHLPYRLYKRGDIWHAYYSIVCPDGKRVITRESTGRTGREEAERAAIKRAAEISQKRDEDGRINYTLTEAFAKYYTEQGQYLTNPETVFKTLKMFNEELGVKYLDDIRETTLTAWVATRRERNKPSTINRYLNVLSSVLRTADEDWNAKVYPLRIGRFKLKEPAENIKYLQDWDIAQRIIDKAAPHLKPIIYTALYTGLRLGNLLNLKWQDVDFNNRTITVKVKDKTREGGKVHTIPIIPKLEDVLRQIEPVGEYVFTYKGEKIGSIKSSWKAIFYKRESSGKRFTHELKDPTLPYTNFHTLRHTAATWILKATGDLRATKEILGHANISTTLKYAHILDRVKRDALDKTFGG